MDIEKLKYPIGKYVAPGVISNEMIEEWIERLETFPVRLKAVCEGLTVEEMNLRYRPDGWMLKQVIHHLADSHSNAYIRIKLALTEDDPVIKPYFEERWAETHEALNGSANHSIDLLVALHAKLVLLLRSLSPHELNRTYFHPEHQLQFTIIYIIGMYAWHGDHHLAQISNTIKR
ncbi:MAG: putative metal-dependent hydrolase [Pedobacter sp.]|nr:MAG: putative metal-dependent hydrolase [Pedobacter sp.]